MSYNISLILLAGGKGARFGTDTPKQYLPLLGKPLILYSYELFLKMEEINEIIIVCDKEYEHLFPPSSKKVLFARPGSLRQESVLNGLNKCSSKASLIAIHDGARPFIRSDTAKKVFQEASIHQAAIVAVPAKNTIKVSDSNQFIKTTPDRKSLWEAQTPQVIEPSLLKKGYAALNSSVLTDDASLIEHINHPVKLVMGCYSNIKITTKDDWILATALAKERYVNI